LTKQAKTVSKSPEVPEVNQKLTYEESRDQLIEIVNQLEAGETNLDTALKLWEQGDKLAKFCAQYLQNAKEKLASSVDLESS
jgi:exodeoxyribonuclease VII small subunit